MNCELISDHLADYINRVTSEGENTTIVTHLAVCAKCREEAADLLRIARFVQNLSVDVPRRTADSAFKKIPQKTLEEIIAEAIPVSDVFKQLHYSLKIFRQSFGLVKIGI